MMAAVNYSEIYFLSAHIAILSLSKCTCRQ